MSQEQFNYLCRVEGWRVFSQTGQWFTVWRDNEERIIRVKQNDQAEKQSG